MFFTEACRGSTKMSFLSSNAIDASYFGFFSDVKCVSSLLNDFNRLLLYRHFTPIDSAPLLPILNSNVPRPFLRPYKIKWRIKGWLHQTTLLHGSRIKLLPLVTQGHWNRSGHSGHGRPTFSCTRKIISDTFYNIFNSNLDSENQ